jgi:hypothetical protein
MEIIQNSFENTCPNIFEWLPFEAVLEELYLALASFFKLSCYIYISGTFILEDSLGMSTSFTC